MESFHSLRTVASHFTTDTVLQMGRERYIEEILIPGLMEVALGKADYTYIPVLLADLAVECVFNYPSQTFVDQGSGTIDYLILVDDREKAALWFTQFERLLANLLP